MEIIDTEYNSNSELVSVTVNDCGDILVFEKPPVRCKDCENWNNGDCYRLELSRPDDFCSYGKRKDGADDD